MRDPRKLRAFELADQFALLVYKHTSAFPREEQFGLTSQVRRAAVSIPSNIVEGCARATNADYLRFLDIAYGSSSEANYQISLAHRLGFLDVDKYNELQILGSETARVLAGLIRSVRSPAENSPNT
ncbi:MAG: four helix bundle protein [Planctomycetota bacterium]|jgi:four helix bundle protein|nr:four helix bundle protein [Planctomycetota bacterium]